MKYGMNLEMGFWKYLDGFNKQRIMLETCMYL